MDKVKKALWDVREMLLDEISTMLTNIYSENHDGEMPNLEDGEEIVVTADEIGETITIHEMEENHYEDDLVQAVSYTIISFTCTSYVDIILTTTDGDEIECDTFGIDALTALYTKLKEVL